MIWDTINEQWKQYGSKVKKKRDKLTDDDLFEINGNREILASKLQEKYGLLGADAKKQIDKWAGKLKA